MRLPLAMRREAMTAALATSEVRERGLQTLLLYPQAGCWNDFGWGSGSTMSVTYTDEASRQRWSGTVKADGGLQWFGARYAEPPDRKIAKGFARELLHRIRTTELI